MNQYVMPKTEPWEVAKFKDLQILHRQGEKEDASAMRAKERDCYLENGQR